MPTHLASSGRALASFLLLGTLAACGVADAPAAPGPVAPTLARRSMPAPAPLVTVPVGGTTLTFWPFTSATASTPDDPVNVIFGGAADPVGIREALVRLDGDRSAYGLPNAFPFNCTWSDAVGEMQTTYAEPTGWVGAAIQLQCGDYTPMRFHLRLFDTGTGITLGGAHMDLWIPGTADHRVISWMLARQLVTIDLVRSGLLAAPPSYTTPITPTPSYREIEAVLYNALPTALRAAIGGPLTNVTAPVPVPSDGRAAVLLLATTPDPQHAATHRQFVLQYDITIPKPFCAAGAFDYIHIAGPVTLDQQTVVTPSGNYVSQFHAVGHLDITPVDPRTSPPTPLGDTYRALVNEHHTGILANQTTHVSSDVMEILLPPSAPFRGRMVMSLEVGPGGVSYGVTADCGR